MINYFYVENAYAGENALTLNGSYGMTNVQYTSTPDAESSWKKVVFDTGTKKANITIPQSGKVYLRGNNTALSNKDSKDNSIISCSQSFNVGGDLTTLLVPEGNVLDLTGKNYVFCYLFYNTKLVNVSKLILPATTLANCCYNQMFRGCTSLVIAPKLSATTLAPYCYAGMFMNCTSLTTAPVLPATTLTKNCYVSMFEDCTSLTTAPELPATELADICYASMFEGCTSLVTAPEILPATILADSCYYEMFRDCTSLVIAPKLPATTLAKSCYQYMFYNCKSLTTAPELPATTLATWCYQHMFNGCTSLVKAPELPATTLANDCYESMFSGCTSLTQAPELPATTLAMSCYAGMFMNCTSLTTAPVLPATKLADFCYSGLSMFSPKGMFRGCKSLNKVTALFTDNSAAGLDNWLDDTAPTGTFIHNPALSNSVLSNPQIIPEKWTKTPIEVPTCFRVNSTESNTLTIESTVSPVIKYSSDNKSWTEYSAPVEFSGTLYLCGANSDLSTTTFKFTKPISTDADITTLLNGIGGKELPQDVFKDIFKGNTITEIRVKGNNLTNRAQTYVYDGANVQQVVLHILNKDKKTYSEWRANINEKGKLINLVRIGLVK